MIGRVVTPLGEAVMEDSGAWAAADPGLAAYLNLAHPPDSGLSVLPFGVGAVMDAAAAMSGHAEYARPAAPYPPGSVS